METCKRCRRGAPVSAPLFEVVLAPSRYRVRIDEHSWRLMIESFGRGVTLPEVNAESSERWIQCHRPQTIATLVRLGVDAGLLADLWLLGHDPQSIDRQRLPSALFASPKLAPCGTCGNWCGIEASRCDGCEADPRVIVEACERCDGRGEVWSIPGGTLPCDCPLCDGSKVAYTGTGDARADYLSRAVAAEILTDAERSASIVEE